MDFQFRFKANTKLVRQSRSDVERAMAATIELDILPDAKARSPFEFGTNRRSITGNVIREGGKVGGQIFTESGYGGYLELGTSRMAPRPYITPAVRRGAKALARNYREITEGRSG